MKHSMILFFLVAIILSFYFVEILKPSNTKAFVFFYFWLCSPYLLLIFLLRLWLKDKEKIKLLFISSFLVSALGFYVLADIIFIHPDPQGGIAVLFVPIIQFIAIVTLLPFLSFIIRKYNKND